jgi:hypothetical protein
MATTGKESLTPTELVKGKFGPQVKVGKDYYSFSKNYKDGALEVGTLYEVEVYTSDKGYKYINSVSGQSKAVKAVTPEKATAVASDLKTRQIQAQGVWQSAASNPALIGYASDIEAFKKVVREIAEDGLAFISEKTK